VSVLITCAHLLSLPNNKTYYYCSLLLIIIIHLLYLLTLVPQVEAAGAFTMQVSLNSHTWYFNAHDYTPYYTLYNTFHGTLSWCFHNASVSRFSHLVHHINHYYYCLFALPTAFGAFTMQVSQFLHLVLCRTLLHTLPGRYHVGTIEYVLPPTIQSLTPSSGPVQGGILVTLGHARVPLVNSIMLLVEYGCVGVRMCGKEGEGQGEQGLNAMKEACCMAVSCSPSK
jgi:hypothetical protein